MAVEPTLTVVLPDTATSSPEPTIAEPAAMLTSAAASSVPPTEPPTSTAPAPTLQEYSVPPGSRPHDVAPAPDDTVCYTAPQGLGQLGRLDPHTGETHHIPLGSSTAPHGVI